MTEFCKRHVTKTDWVVGGLFVGGLFFRPYMSSYPDLSRCILGSTTVLPKVCAAYFVGKGGLLLLQKRHPSYYEELMHDRSELVTRVWKWIVPDDYMKCVSPMPLTASCYNVVRSLFEPYLSHFDNFTPFSILGSIYKGAVNQVYFHFQMNERNPFPSPPFLSIRATTPSSPRRCSAAKWPPGCTAPPWYTA